MRPSRCLAVATCAAFAFLTVCSSALPAERQDLGRAHFPTSGSPEAQAHFLEGLLFLHSFEYPDAREAFRAAREVEPGFAMAAWGEAMTHNHPIWMRVEEEAGRKALEELAPTAEERQAKAPTAREKAYLAAVEILFSGEGTKLERDIAYADAMEAIHEAYPKDLEAASFYALALLGTCHEGRDVPTYMRAAAVVEEVFDANPLHPGAAHYLIHSYDDPVHAPLGVRAARVYATIAPAAEHALHMPSHVFLALGWWDRTAASNEDSWQASEDAVAARSLSSERRGYHALLWLEYAYLQLGRWRDARELLAIMEADAEASGSKRTQSHLAMMRAHYLVETERWGAAIRRPDLEATTDSSAAADRFATGWAAARRGDLEAAEAELAAMGGPARAEADADAGADHCAAPEASRDDEAAVMALELEAAIHRARGEAARAVELLERAAAQEDGLSFGFGPPSPVKPSHELLGELLLEMGRPADAREQFEKALARAPRRVRSLQGLERAARRLGDGEAAAASAATLAEILDGADPEARTEAAGAEPAEAAVSAASSGAGGGSR